MWILLATIGKVWATFYSNVGHTEDIPFDPQSYTR